MIIRIPLFNKKDTSIDAITLCFVIIVWVKDPSDRLIKHEKRHVEQWKERPFTFHVRYFYEMFSNKLKGMTWRAAYESISFENEARDAETKDQNSGANPQ